MNPSSAQAKRGDCPPWCCGQHDQPTPINETIHCSCVAAIPVIARPRNMVTIPDIFDPLLMAMEELGMDGLDPNTPDDSTFRAMHSTDEGSRGDWPHDEEHSRKAPNGGRSWAAGSSNAEANDAEANDAGDRIPRTSATDPNANEGNAAESGATKIRETQASAGDPNDAGPSRIRVNDTDPDEMRVDDWQGDEATYFEVVRLQSALGGDEWVYIGAEPHSMMVTVESARRIFRAMAQILGS